MDLGHGSLLAAGIIGSGVALVHSYLVQRFFVRAERGADTLARRMTPALLQFSGFNWSLSGIALMAVGLGMWPGAATIVCLLAGSSYLYGAIGNLWATRGRHPGWALYAVALVLIAIGMRELG